MLVRVFQAEGAAEIAKIEARINAWLADLPNHAQIKQTNTALCAAGAVSVGEQPQSLVVTIWWDRLD
jgi:hypothetical protein